MPKRTKRVVVIVLLVAALGAIGWLAHELGLPLPFFADDSGQNGRGHPSGRGASPRADQQQVVALGRVEPAGGLIEISGIAGDRLASLQVEAEGSPVKKGQPLAYLESRCLRQLEWESAQAALREAQSRFAAEEKSADARILTARLAVRQSESRQQDIQVQQIKLELLRANLELATKDRDRLKGLSPDLVSDQQRERQMLVVRQAEAELSTAEALLKKMIRTKELSLKAARADLKAARAGKPQVLTAIPIESLKKNVEMAKILWQRTAIVAPCDGTILKIFIRPGESIGTQPILQMANLQQMVVVAMVYETDVKRVELGQHAVVASRTFKPPYDQRGLEGKVTRIGRLITTPGLRSIDPFDRVDRHVVEVRIRLDEEGCTQARRLSNLQVDVTISKTATGALVNR